ncbi:MAG: hypothetical protein VB084_09365 [Syntrophomonadaceae bacterium]|nr:hypothetical protein [Syntrophomonadaceae bacterium]
MRITINNKPIQTCFLLCSLLLLECFNYGIIFLAPLGASGINEPASWSGEVNSAMGDRVNADLDVMAAVSDSTRLTLAPTGKTRGLGFTYNYFFSAVMSALLLAGLLSYLRLSRQIYFQFDSLQITAFLHQKDGKK